VLTFKKKFRRLKVKIKQGRVGLHVIT
jgi:hypothetical protein